MVVKGTVVKGLVTTGPVVRGLGHPVAEHVDEAQP
jgi:hypothetical protein